MLGVEVGKRRQLSKEMKCAYDQAKEVPGPVGGASGFVFPAPSPSSQEGGQEGFPGAESGNSGIEQVFGEVPLKQQQEGGTGRIGKKKKKFELQRKKDKLTAAARDWATGKFKKLR